LNTQVFDDAAMSDLRRASGIPPGYLEGIPCTIKKSYKIKDMTVASGSPAFKDLLANEDAFTVKQLKEAGAIFLGKTNMPPCMEQWRKIFQRSLCDSSSWHPNSQ
jgi:amidase